MAKKHKKTRQTRSDALRETITLKVSKDDQIRLQRLARREHTSVSALARAMIRAGFDIIEQS